MPEIYKKSSFYYNSRKEEEVYRQDSYKEKGI